TASRDSSHTHNRATRDISTLSLHDALPIWRRDRAASRSRPTDRPSGRRSMCPSDIEARPKQKVERREESTRPGAYFHPAVDILLDRKSTRLNSSHQIISYAVFCLKKKKSIQ